MKDLVSMTRVFDDRAHNQGLSLYDNCARWEPSMKDYHFE